MKATLRTAPIFPLVAPSFPVKSEASYLAREENSNSYTMVDRVCQEQIKKAQSLSSCTFSCPICPSPANLQYSATVIIAGSNGALLSPEDLGTAGVSVSMAAFCSSMLSSSSPSSKLGLFVFERLVIRHRFASMAAYHRLVLSSSSPLS